MKKSIVNLFVLISVSLITGCSSHESRVRHAVRTQLFHYPASTLTDIYKSFFQDEFGPGHILGDTAKAREYFNQEVKDMQSVGNHMAEPCGTGRNFYRVPMDLVKDGVVSDTAYFEAFIKSAGSFRQPDIDSWKKDWARILQVVINMHLELPHFGADRKAIDTMLAKGDYMVHHSQAYTGNYDPHYRIMSKQQWRWLKKQFRH